MVRVTINICIDMWDYDNYHHQTNEALQKALIVKIRITAAYHPQSNGLDQRTNQTLKR